MKQSCFEILDSTPEKSNKQKLQEVQLPNNPFQDNLKCMQFLNIPNIICVKFVGKPFKQLGNLTIYLTYRNIHCIASARLIKLKIFKMNA